MYSVLFDRYIDRETGQKFNGTSQTTCFFFLQKSSRSAKSAGLHRVGGHHASSATRSERGTQIPGAMTRGWRGVNVPVMDPVPMFVPI